MSYVSFLRRAARWYIHRARWELARRRFPRRPDGRLLVHLGCGEIDKPGWVNVDARSFPHVHVVTQRPDRLSLFPDGSVDLVYLSHVLEHLPRARIGSALSEFFRILRPGGTVRVSVPDFDLLVEMYQSSGRNVMAITQPLMGGQRSEWDFHYTVFNRPHLQGLLEGAGFEDVAECNGTSVEDHGFDDWSVRPVPWEGR